MGVKEEIIIMRSKYGQLTCLELHHFTHCHSSCHVVDTQLSTVPAHNTKVDAIEDEGDTQLHDGVRMQWEEKTNASED